MDGIFNSETPSFVPETDILGIGKIEKENFGLGGDRLAGAMALELPEETTPYYIEEGRADLLLNGQNEAAANGHLLLGNSGYIETDSGGDLLIGHTEEMSQLEGEDLLTGGGLAIEKMVADAVPKVRELLQGFAEQPEFEVEMGLAFGNSYDGEKADVLKAGFSGGYLEVLPEIEIVNRHLINGANGAFAGETETIYLAREFVSENLGDVGAIAPVIVEEFGHYIDWEINSIDAPGDEGEIFASFVLGEELSLPEFLGMKVEDDGATVFLDGEMVAIEQANVSWVGGSGDWYNPSKWSNGKVPKSSDNVTVQALDQRINISFSKGNPNIRDLFLAAKDGGSLTLNGLTTVGNDTDILAEGNNSVVKLPDLKTFSGKDVYQPSSITVKDGGQFEAKKLATMKEVDLFANNSSLTLPGVKSFSGKSDTVIKATNEGKLSLTAKTISNDVDITATGEGSVVQLPRLTAFNGKNVYGPSFILAEDGGTVQANKLKTIKDVHLYADNSKLNLSGASSFSGTDDTVIRATNEGKLSLTAKTISGDVDITATGEGSVVQLSRLTAFNGKNVYGPSFILAEDGGKVKANKLKTVTNVDPFVTG